MRLILTVLAVYLLSSCTITPSNNELQESTLNDSIVFSAPAQTAGNWIISKDTAIAMIKHFGEVYRHDKREIIEQRTDSLSKAVWFSKEMIAQLNAYLQNPKYELDGVRIYMGAYFSLDNKKAPGQVYNNQSTLVWVPTNAGINGTHKDNWDVIKNLEAYAPMDAYNHGTLCPQICDTLP